MSNPIVPSTMLMDASHQWSSRPADQRFGSLADLHAATTHHKDVAVEAHGVNLSLLSVAVADEEPVLVGQTGTTARFTHHGFSQLARRINAPASYLRTLPATLVAENMNHGLKAATEMDNDTLLFARNGELRLRAAQSPAYTRIWNSDITGRLIRLTEAYPEWQPAPAAFDGSRGLYASDADMFAFLVNNDRRIFERGPAGGLSRGFFVANSEVGTASFSITTFMYEYVCGNHRVWGASGVQKLSIRHVGMADERAFGELGLELTKYADGSIKEDEARVERARMKSLGASKDEVLDMVFGLRIGGLSRKVLEASYAAAEAHEDWYGSPRTAWGLTGGMTEVARDLPNASERVALEAASGRVLELAF